MGLWHGANWTFVLWGLYHAVCVFGYRILADRVPSPRGWVGAVVGWAITLPVMMLGWIPFRAGSVREALVLMGKALDPAPAWRRLACARTPIWWSPCSCWALS